MAVDEEQRRQYKRDWARRKRSANPAAARVGEAARRADGVAVLDGWKNSRGAQLEVSIATALGVRVAPVAEWLLEAAESAPLPTTPAGGEGDA